MIIILKYNIENNVIHLCILLSFSIIFWLTPYYLSGYSHFPDSLFHGGISKDIVNVLKRPSINSLFNYGKEYPASYIFNYICMKIMNIDITIYSNIVYPIYCTIAYVVLWYIFISKLFTNNISFISTFVAIIFLGHIPTIHLSPQSAGTILLMTAVILFHTFNNKISILLGYLISYVIIITHPISPIILIIFLLAPYIINILYPNQMRKIKGYSNTGVLCILSSWFFWVLNNTITTRKEVIKTIYDILTLNFYLQLEELSIKATTTNYYIYPKINVLTKFVEYGLLFSAFLIYLNIILSLYIRSDNKNLLKQIGRQLGYERLFLTFISFMLFSLSFLLIISEFARITVFERSYFYFVISISAFIGSYLYYKNHKLMLLKIFIIMYLIFACLAFPIIAYHKEGPKGYPYSECIGLEFISSNMNVNQKMISMYPYQQLASFIDSNTQIIYPLFDVFSESNFLGIYEKPLPDIVVLRKTMNLRIAAEFDLSLKNNRYTQAIKTTNNMTNFNKIYSTTTLKMYIKIEK